MRVSITLVASSYVPFARGRHCSAWGADGEDIFVSHAPPNVAGLGTFLLRESGRLLAGGPSSTLGIARFDRTRHWTGTAITLASVERPWMRSGGEPLEN